MIIKAKNLSYGYNPNKLVINNVSLEIEQGDFVGILGPNGSGKTTLLKMLSGFIHPVQGEVKIKGQNIKNIPVEKLAKIRSLVPQESHLEFDYTVEEIVWMGRNPYSNLLGVESGQSEVKKAIEECDLNNLKQRNARNLSGGEWQRVVLARVLAQDTEIIFLDEPTHFLDIYYQLNVLEIMKKLNKTGKTIVVVFHDINLAANYCEKLIMLKAGEIFAQGNKAKVLTVENIKNLYGLKTNVLKFQENKRVVFSF